MNAIRVFCREVGGGGRLCPRGTPPPLSAGVQSFREFQRKAAAWCPRTLSYHCRRPPAHHQWNPRPPCESAFQLLRHLVHRIQPLSFDDVLLVLYGRLNLSRFDGGLINAASRDDVQVRQQIVHRRVSDGRPLSICVAHTHVPSRLLKLFFSSSTAGSLQPPGTPFPWAAVSAVSISSGSVLALIQHLGDRRAASPPGHGKTCATHT